MRKISRNLSLLFAACFLVSLSAGCSDSRPSQNSRAGYEALLSSDYSSAQQSFENALSSGEDPVQAGRGLGIALMGQARYEEAVNAFQTALASSDDKMEKTVKDILLYKASAQYRMKDYEGTILTCGQLEELDDSLSELYFYRGASYLCNHDTDKARVNFDQAVNLERNNYELYLDIYSVYDEMNMTGIGDEYLQTALSITPSDTDDYYQIGRIYFYLEQYDEAQQALFNPVSENYIPALSLMGQIYLAREDYDNAKATYTMIQSLEGENTDSYNGLALCALEANDLDSALVYINAGLALAGNEGKQELYFNEIVAYERMLDFQTALAKCRDYVDRYPSDAAGQKELDFLSTR